MHKYIIANKVERAERGAEGRKWIVEIKELDSHKHWCDMEMIKIVRKHPSRDTGECIGVYTCEYMCVNVCVSVVEVGKCGLNEWWDEQ